MAGPNIAQLHPRLRTIARNLPRAAAAVGFNARVTSGYRSSRSQARLYNEYLQGRALYVVAPPGTSLHEKGLAIDVVTDDQNSLVRLLTQAGLTWAGPDDPVHFSAIASPTRSYAQKTASQSWRGGPGSSIPSWAESLPIVGLGLGIAKDPWKVAKDQAKKLLTAITGGWL